MDLEQTKEAETERISIQKKRSWGVLDKKWAVVRRRSTTCQINQIERADGRKWQPPLEHLYMCKSWAEVQGSGAGDFGARGEADIARKALVGGDRRQAAAIG